MTFGDIMLRLTPLPAAFVTVLLQARSRIDRPRVLAGGLKHSNRVGVDLVRTLLFAGGSGRVQRQP